MARFFRLCYKFHYYDITEEMQTTCIDWMCKLENENEKSAAASPFIAITITTM